jgi:hypothetical protein
VQAHNRENTLKFKFEPYHITVTFEILISFLLLLLQCSLVLPSTCGIPSGFARHFSQSWKVSQVDSDLPVRSQSVESRAQPCKLEGYVKIPKYVSLCRVTNCHICLITCINIYRPKEPFFLMINNLHAQQFYNVLNFFTEVYISCATRSVPFYGSK